MKSEQSDTASVRYENAELLHHAFGSVGGSCRKQNPTLIFRADYIEHHFEARATLPPILGALCNRLFLFFSKRFSRFYIQKSNDRLNGICSPAKYRHDCKLHERTKENETPE